MLIKFILFAILVLVLGAWFEVQHDLKQKQKEYDRNKELDEMLKVMAIGGHWTDHNGVAHYDPELEKLNMTPERMALRQQYIDDAKKKVEEYERKTKAKGW